MTKRLALLLIGTTLLVSTTGCCGWPFGYGYGYGGRCPSGNCGAQPGVMQPGAYYQQQGAYYAPQSAIQTTTPIPGPVAAPIYGSPYPATALGPMESLPTY